MFIANFVFPVYIERKDHVVMDFLFLFSMFTRIFSEAQLTLLVGNFCEKNKRIFSLNDAYCVVDIYDVKINIVIVIVILLSFIRGNAPSPLLLNFAYIALPKLVDLARRCMTQTWVKVYFTIQTGPSRSVPWKMSTVTDMLQH